ncbi:MAG: prolyl oligopeptidase family serine peptidase [Planctomycetaceae bacterium]|nr:prolyl oligopeptidase family serine peptidase [Planctomycetaceae bacterium]
MSFRTAALLCFLLLSNTGYSDGERDNNALDVRRVPKEGIDVPADREAALRDQLKQLQERIRQFTVMKKGPSSFQLIPDITVFERAVRVALDHKEFFDVKDLDKADQLLREGISRADQWLAGNPTWHLHPGLVVRGYVSRIDNTVQPYGLVVPETYAFNNSVPTRCDMWFHGRGETLSEVNFIWDRMKNAGQYTPANTIVLHPYGRYSNAFKFAGEVDVLEALEDVQRRYRIDEDRISVRGFSMGGAACWQFATHYSDRWFAANPGAGFSETPEFLKFFQKEALNPTPWEVKLWNMYDCDKYAGNLIHCPTIAYSGENDIQKQAADLMETALKDRGIRLRHIIGAGMGHKIDDVSKEIIEDGMASLAKRGRQPAVSNLSLSTPTLKYNRMEWLTIDAVNEHWTMAEVKAHIAHPATTVHLAVSNVTKLTVNFPSGSLRIPSSHMDVNISSQSPRGLGLFKFDSPFSDGSFAVTLELKDGKTWQIADMSATSEGLRKRHNLQGPIDDAFMDSFIFVSPSGSAAHEAVDKWTTSELERAIEHWRRHFRGDARVVQDTEVTQEMIQSSNLILWGDASSNLLIERTLKDLPLNWSDDQLSIGSHTVDAKTHAPIMIYPNPLNPDRYVVLNSSFTFRDYAYLNNARQVPMLPDWAIIDLSTPPGNVWPGKVVAADFFDEKWQVK